jgi:hypothetical protein
MSSFRFSSNIFGLKSHNEFAAMCRRAENYGYDTIFAADHLGHAAPFQAVVAAAAATERLPARGRPRVRPHEVGVRRGRHPLGTA